MSHSIYTPSYAGAGSREMAPSRGHGLSTEEAEFALDKRRRGVSVAGIAKMLGRPVSSVIGAFPAEPVRASVSVPEPEPPVAEPIVTEAPRIPRIMADIVSQVAPRHGVTPEMMLGDSRRAPVAHARWEAWTLIYALKWQNGSQRFSKSQIGRYFGKDHTSVMSGLRRWEELTTPPAQSEAA